MAEKEIVKETKEEKSNTEEVKEETKAVETKPHWKMTAQEREIQEREKALEEWQPKTELGKKVRNKEIKDIDTILKNNKILESEIWKLILDLQIISIFRQTRQAKMLPKSEIYSFLEI